MTSIKTNRVLYNSIKTLIKDSKGQIVRKVNSTIILTYYEIGKMIVEYEQNGKARVEYADQTLKQLSIDLTKDFGKGFSHRNLEYFRKFFLNYSNRISADWQKIVYLSNTLNSKLLNFTLPSP